MVDDKKKPEKKEVKQKEFTFYLLVGLLMESYVDKVISVLVKRGYTVAPLADSGKAYTAVDKNVCTIAQLLLKKNMPEDTKDGYQVVMKDVKDVLEVIKAKWFMSWVGQPEMCTWALGNVILEDDRVNQGPYRSSGKGTGLN